MPSKDSDQRQWVLISAEGSEQPFGPHLPVVVESPLPVWMARAPGTVIAQSASNDTCPSDAWSAEQEESAPRTPFAKSFDAGLARDSVKVDEAILELKGMYDRLDAENRAALKSWIGRLEPLQTSPFGCWVRGTVQVQIEFNDFVVDTLEPITILRAIESWERDEPFGPHFTARGWA